MTRITVSVDVIEEADDGIRDFNRGFAPKPVQVGKGYDLDKGFYMRLDSLFCFFNFILKCVRSSLLGV
jgi:hypothetical protein